MTTIYFTLRNRLVTTNPSWKDYERFAAHDNGEFSDFCKRRSMKGKGRQVTLFVGDRKEMICLGSFPPQARLQSQIMVYRDYLPKA